MSGVLQVKDVHYISIMPPSGLFHLFSPIKYYVDLYVICDTVNFQVSLIFSNIIHKRGNE